MVKGLDSFKKWFRGFEANFVIIGGTACDLLMSGAGAEFRATKDIDMVLIVEALDASFGSRFWEYIKKAEYEHRVKSTGAPEYYRFTNPKTPEYPAMIELFSRSVDGIALPQGAILTPLPIDDDISSLSAILLDNDYYSFLRDGVTVVESVPILDAAHLIPFKAKAWLDLTERKRSGGQVDSKNVKKHKNDIVRLTALLSSDFKMALSDTLAKDMRSFLLNVDEPEKFNRTAAAYGLSDSVPHRRPSLMRSLEQAQRRADEHNANLDGRRRGNITTNHDHER